MKLKVARIKHVNPSTKAMGYCTRVVTNGRILTRLPNGQAAILPSIRLKCACRWKSVWRRPARCSVRGTSLTWVRWGRSIPVATADGLNGLRTCGWSGCAPRFSTVRRAGCSRRSAVPPSSGCVVGRKKKSSNGPVATWRD